MVCGTIAVADGLLGVVPVLIGPLQALFAILPGLLVAIGAGIAGIVVSIFSPGFLLGLVKVSWRLKWYTLGFVLVTGGGIYGAVKYWPAHQQVVTLAARGANEDWPVFRGGLARTGAAEGAYGPVGGAIAWSRGAGSEWFYSSPSVVGNRVFVASAKLTAFDRKDGEGKIYCLDANTGAVAWAAEPTFTTGAKNYRATFASPVIKGDYLVCGEGLHYAEKARIVCLSLKDGRMLWHHQTNSHVECSPVIAPVKFRDANGADREEDRVFVGAGDDGYYCLALKTGQLRWHLPAARYGDAETSLVVHDGRVYAGLGIEGKALCVLDAASGRELRRVPMPYPVFSPPAIVDGKLLVGMGNGDFVASGNPPAGEVWRFDLAKLNADGNASVAPDWKCVVGDTVLGSVAVAGDEAYFATVDGYVHCVDRRSGAAIGKWCAHSPIKASPAVGAEHVYVITSAGMLYGLTRRDLVPAWEYRVGTAPECISSPAIAGGRLFVGTQNDGLVCLAGKGGAAAGARKSKTYLWPTRLAGPDKGGNLFGSPPPRAGELHWQFPADQDGTNKEAVVTAPPALVGGNLLVPMASGKLAGLACVPTNSDETPKPLWTIADPVGVHASPAVVGDAVLFVTGKIGDANRALTMAGAADGKVRWRRAVERFATGALTATPKEVFVQDGPNGFASVSLNGKPGWSVGVGGKAAGGPGVTDNIVIVSVSSSETPGTSVPGTLAALDRATGCELWRIGLAGAPVTGPYIYRTTVYVGTSAGLEARNMVDGAALPATGWKMQGGAVSGDFVVTAAHLVFINRSGELVVLQRDDGSLAFAPLAGAKVGGSPLVGGNTIVYEAADGKMMSVTLEAPASQPASQPATAPAALAPKVWFANDDKWLGECATPMVLSGSAVYMGRAGWGLVRLGEPK